MSYVFDTPGPLTLDVRVAGGRVEIETREANDARVELTPLSDDSDTREALESARVELKEQGEGLTLYVEVPRSAFSFFASTPQVHVGISAPHGPNLDVSTKSADVSGRGRFGGVQVKTASGDVALDEAVEADVKVASGDVHLGHVSWEAKVQSASGRVHLDHVQGSAKAQSASGDITVERADADLKIQTASGDQRIGCIREGKVTLQSASGDLDIGIQRGSSVWIDAKSMSGETRSELEVEEAPQDREGPQIELRATAMSGDISVAGAAPVPS